jgi:hypothetical protein
VDSDLAPLASTAATTLVGLLVTDGWEQAKDAVVGLWRRVSPAHADTVITSLNDTRTALLADDDEAAARTRISEWQDRLARVGASDPDLVGELFDTLARLRPAALPRVEMTARASGHGQVHQAGRDMTIARR